MLIKDPDPVFSRIWVTQKDRIRPDPDPQHWFLEPRIQDPDQRVKKSIKTLRKKTFFLTFSLTLAFTCLMLSIRFVKQILDLHHLFQFSTPTKKK